MKLRKLAFLLVGVFAVFLVSHVLRCRSSSAKQYVRVTRDAWRRQAETIGPEVLAGPLHLGDCSPLSTERRVTSVQHLRHLTVYRSQDSHNNTNFLRFECVPKLSRYNYGAQGLGEVLADTVVKLLQLPLAMPCVEEFVLPTSTFSRSVTNDIAMAYVPEGRDEYPVHQHCIFERDEEQVVFGTMTGDAGGDLIHAERNGVMHPKIEPRWLSLFRVPTPSRGEEDEIVLSPEERIKLADISNIMLLDFFVANNDRGFSKNWFYSSSLMRFIAIDNGYLFGEYSVCSAAFSRWTLTCPPLLARLVQEHAPQPGEGGGEQQHASGCGYTYQNCVFSRTAVQRLQKYHHRLTTNLRQVLGQRVWLQKFEDLTRGRQLLRETSILLRRSTTDCPGGNSELSFEDALDLIVEGTIARVLDALQHINACRQQYGDEYVLQLP